MGLFIDGAWSRRPHLSQPKFALDQSKMEASTDAIAATTESVKDFIGAEETGSATSFCVCTHAAVVQVVV